MANLNFSVLDLLFISGLILLFFRVRNNGFLKELVFISILFTYCYLTLNNLKTVYDYFDDGGYDYLLSIYNVFLGLFACAGMPFVNFFTGLYIPKLKGVINLILGCIIAIVRFLLLIFFNILLFNLIPNVRQPLTTFARVNILRQPSLTRRLLKVVDEGGRSTMGQVFY